MEFNKKLQELRKQKGLTQEELAAALFVSRTAISKWESGRGYPSLASLKEIAKFFSISVDHLLSYSEVLNIAEEDTRKKTNFFISFIFSLLDISTAALLFLPFFGEKIGKGIQSVPLLSLSQISPWLKMIYFIIICSTILFGIFTLFLQKWDNKTWNKTKRLFSLLFNAIGLFVLILSLQPYAAIYLFLLLTIKALILTKR